MRYSNIAERVHAIESQKRIITEQKNIHDGLYSYGNKKIFLIRQGYIAENSNPWTKIGRFTSSVGYFILEDVDPFLEETTRTMHFDGENIIEWNRGKVQVTSDFKLVGDFIEVLINVWLSGKKYIYNVLPPIALQDHIDFIIWYDMILREIDDEITLERL